MITRRTPTLLVGITLFAAQIPLTIAWSGPFCNDLHEKYGGGTCDIPAYQLFGLLFFELPVAISLMVVVTSLVMARFAWLGSMRTAAAAAGRLICLVLTAFCVWMAWRESWDTPPFSWLFKLDWIAVAIWWAVVALLTKQRNKTHSANRG